jgi:hypothetical protein
MVNWVILEDEENLSQITLPDKHLNWILTLQYIQCTELEKCISKFVSPLFALLKAKNTFYF